MSSSRRRLAQLRIGLTAHATDALWIPSADPHQSEYLPARWRGRAWASGFSGSVGDLVVTSDRAALFVDGRYVLQAQGEVEDAGIEVVATAGPRAAAEAVRDWLVRVLPQGAVVAVDGAVVTPAAADELGAALTRAGMTLRCDHDLLAEAWTDRPSLPDTPLREYAAEEAGATRADKLLALRRAIVERDADAHWTAALDEIAWLLNLRGDDVPFNPVFLAHLLVEPGRCRLFVGGDRIDDALRQRLQADGIEVVAYDALTQALSALAAGTRLLLDPARVSVAPLAAVGEGVRVVAAMNPLQLLKSPRNAIQAARLHEAMAQDGAALCEFFATLDEDLARGDISVTELDLHARVTACRARRPGFQGASFDTIAGFNAHAAMPHHIPSARDAMPLSGDGLLLIDSGGHYLGGTTDITRVRALGAMPSDEQRQGSTRVMKGLIALSRVCFPRGTLAPMLDAIARVPLWAAGLDYGHGTGHGVGHFLNVHEGPQLFSQAAPRPESALLPGMVISIEPGLYRPGQWGIRWENLVMCVPVDEHAETDGFLRFETLSLCPFDRLCLDLTMLDESERAWIDAYHATVRDRLSPLLAGAALGWLIAHTRPLGT